MKLAVPAAIAFALIAIFFFRPHATPGPPMRDFEAYYAAGAAANHGLNPYSLELWQFEAPLDPQQPPQFAYLPFVSPPAIVPVLRGVALLPFGAANALWRALLALCIATIVVTALRMLRTRITAETFAMGACICVGFGPLTSALALGQLALPAYALAFAAVTAPAAAFFAFVQPNVAATLLSQLGRNRIAVAFGAGAVALVLSSGPGYAAILSAHGAAEQFSAIQVTPVAILYGAGVPQSAAAAIGVVIAIAAVAAAAFAMRLLRDAWARFALAGSVLPFVMPFFHEHDLIVAFAPALVVVSRCNARVQTLAFTAAAFAAVDWLGLAQRPDGALQSALLTGAFILGLQALNPESSARRAATALAIVVWCVALAAFFGSLHPLGIWPDAMAPFPPASSAAATWHAEQAATGLFDRDPVWAALRTCSLAGCAALAVLVVKLDVGVSHEIERRNAVGMKTV